MINHDKSHGLELKVVQNDSVRLVYAGSIDVRKGSRSFIETKYSTYIYICLRDTDVFEPIHLCQIVVEVSLLPMAWSGAMKQLDTTLAG